MTKLLTYLQPILKSKEDAKWFHWWFSIFFILHDVMHLHYVKDLHQLNGVETRPLIRTTNKHLFDYDIEAEITHNTLYVPLFTVT